MKNRETDRGIEKSDPGSRDTCRGGRSVSSVSSEEKNTGNDRKRKRPGPLAAVIILQKLKMPLLEEAEKYVSEEKGVVCAEDAIAGAKDIIAESISDEADYRSWIRKNHHEKGN